MMGAVRCWLADAHFSLRTNAYPLEMLAEETGASDEGVLVSLDFEVASEELDRYVGRFGGVVGSGLGQ